MTGIERRVDQPQGEPHTLNWTFDYDDDGNRNEIVEPGSPARITTTIDHDGRNLPWRTTVAGGNGSAEVERTSITEYDASGALRRTVSPAGIGAGNLPDRR